MTKIVVYDPSHPDVTNAVTEYNASANTPDYNSEPNKLVNPDLDGLEGVVSTVYWKVTGSPPAAVVEMSEVEKDLISPAVAETSILNTGNSCPATEDAYFCVNRSCGGSPNIDAILKWNEATDKWQAGIIGTEVDIILADHTHEIGDLSDVDLTGSPGPVDGDILTYNGSSWVHDQNASGSVFGSHFYQGASAGESSTTSTSFQQKLRLTPSSVPLGTYRVGWSYEWNCSSLSSDFKGRVQINDSIDLMEHQEEPQDTGADQRCPHSGFGYWTGSGSPNIDLDYCSSYSSATCYIRNAKLEFWRVS